MARSAKNRRLFFLPGPDMRPNRKYGHPAPIPQEVWRERTGWRKARVEVRGRTRHLQVKVVGVCSRFMLSFAKSGIFRYARRLLEWRGRLGVRIAAGSKGILPFRSPIARRWALLAPPSDFL